MSKPVDLQGRRFSVGDKIARARVNGRSPYLAIETVTRIDQYDQIYTDGSKVPVKFPNRLLIVPVPTPTPNVYAQPEQEAYDQPELEPSNYLSVVPRTQEAILTRICRIVQDFMADGEDRLGTIVVTPETHLAYDIGFDSLDLIELIMAVEDELNIQIPDEEAEKIQRVKDFMNVSDLQGYRK